MFIYSQKETSHYTQGYMVPLSIIQKNMGYIVIRSDIYVRKNVFVVI